MADQKSSITQVTADDKGKSKAENPPPEDASMDEDDNSSEEESGVEEEPVEEEEDLDNMEEISTNNIINDGRRTRGKKIDFTNPRITADLDDDEDDADDGDFEAKEDATDDVHMQD